MRTVGDCVDYSNQTRLQSAIGYLAPLDRLAGQYPAIHQAHDHKREASRAARKLKRQQPIPSPAPAAVA